MSMKSAILVGFVLGSRAMSAFAACSDDVDTFAARYHVAARTPQQDAPGSSSSSSSSSARLQANGGVIAPPATGDMPTITPSLNTDPMVTAPVIQPQVAGEPGDKSAGRVIPGGSSTNLEELTSLVQAARTAAQQGHEADCQQRLADAMKIVATNLK